MPIFFVAGMALDLSPRWAGPIVFVFLPAFIVFAMTHLILSFCHKCPLCGRHPTVQGFKSRHPGAFGQAALKGWSGTVVNILLRRRLVCIHCGQEFTVRSL
jgi:hypothetical protein